MGLIREPEGVDFVIEPHTVAEEEHLSMLAFIAACQDRKAEQQSKINKMKRTFKQPSMIANNLTPFCPTHPGSLVKDELEYRNISYSQFSEKIGLPRSTFGKILDGKRPVTTDIALLIEAALNIPAHILIGLQTDYNLQVAKNDKKLSERISEVRKMASLF